MFLNIVDDGSGTISCVHSQTRLKAKIQKLNYLLSSKRRDETLNNESLNQTEITIANNSTKEKNSDEDTALRKVRCTSKYIQVVFTKVWSNFISSEEAPLLKIYLLVFIPFLNF